MVLKLYLNIFCVVLLVQTCDKSIEFDKSGLTYKDKLVFENEFKINGYYYSPNSGYTAIFFLNGIVNHGGSTNLSIDKNGCITIHDKSRNIPYAWGYFILDESLIKMQTYDPTSLNAFSEYKIQDVWFRILNDTTIERFRIRFPLEGWTDLNDTLYFFHCYPKPDSTNILMD